MKFFGQTLRVLFGLVLLGALGTGGYFALKFIVQLLARMDFQMAMVTAIASVTVLVAAKIIASSIRVAGKHNKAQQFRAEKAATYQQLIDAWEDFLRQGWSPDHQSPGRQSEELHAVERLLILYGAPGVVKAYGELQALATKLGSHSSEVVTQFATVLMEMRQDLGSDMQGLQSEDLLQLLHIESGTSSERPKAQLYQDHRPCVSLTPHT